MNHSAVMDYWATVIEAHQRAQAHQCPYTVVRMHPDTAHLVRMAAQPTYAAAGVLPGLMGMMLLEDDTVEPGRFRFEYEVEGIMRAVSER